MRKDIKLLAIAANLVALRTLLRDAVERTAEAHQLAINGDQNAAIGSVLDLDRQLNDAQALLTAALALHRSTAL